MFHARVGLITVLTSALLLFLATASAWACNEPTLALGKTQAGPMETVPYSIGNADEGAQFTLTVAGRMVASGTAGPEFSSSFTMPDLGSSQTVTAELVITHDGTQLFSPMSLAFAAPAPQPAQQPGGQPPGQPAQQPPGHPAQQPPGHPAQQPPGHPAQQPHGHPAPAGEPGGEGTERRPAEQHRAAGPRRTSDRSHAGPDRKGSVPAGEHSRPVSHGGVPTREAAAPTVADEATTSRAFEQESSARRPAQSVARRGATRQDRAVAGPPVPATLRRPLPVHGAAPGETVRDGLPLGALIALGAVLLAGMAGGGWAVVRARSRGPTPEPEVAVRAVVPPEAERSDIDAELEQLLSGDLATIDVEAELQRMIVDEARAGDVTDSHTR